MSAMYEWEEGPRFRFYNLDYKAAEVKILAAYTLDPVLTKELNAGKDIHSATASIVFNKPYEEFEPEDGNRPDHLSLLRGQVKAFVFGTMYGRGYKSIAKELDISELEAQVLQKKIFDLMPSIPAFTKLVELELKHHGMVSTFMGRKKRFPLAMDPACDRKLFGSFLRIATNFKIQSTSAELVNSRLVEINREIKKRCPEVSEVLNDRIVSTRALDIKLQVHDSIAGQVDTKTISKQEFMDFMNYWACDRINELYPWMPVKFKYDVDFGSSYGAAA